MAASSTAVTTDISISTGSLSLSAGGTQQPVSAVVDSAVEDSNAVKHKETNFKTDDVITGIQIFNLWNHFLTNENQISPEIAWNKCRKLAYDALQVFTERMSSLQKVVQDDVACLKLLDLDSVLEKKNEIDAAVFELEDLDIEMKQVSKAFQTVAQCLPSCPERNHIKNSIREGRRTYFRLLDELAHKREVFRSLDPLLRQYKELGGDIKGWLDATETRCELFIADYNNPEVMLDNEEVIETIYAELCAQKDPYENFLEAGEILFDLNPRETMTELSQDIDDVIVRWDAICSNLERCLNRLQLAKRNALNSKKKDGEKIERQIRCEERQCTCHTPYQIIKTGDGKYKFGTSKINRLVRIHGSSIVVRVGGGWEFLYDFLLKSDPCRIKQLSEQKEMTALNLSGVDRSTVDHKDAEFSLTVRRMAQNWTPQSRARPNSMTGSVDSGTSSDNGCDESCDSAISLSTSTGPSTSASLSNKLMTLTPKTTTNQRRSSTPLFKNKPNSAENFPRRVSLIDRQTDFAEKNKAKRILEKNSPRNK